MFRGTYFVVINFVQKDDFMVGIAAERDDTRDFFTLFTSVFSAVSLKNTLITLEQLIQSKNSILKHLFPFWFLCPVAVKVFIFERELSRLHNFHHYLPYDTFAM